MSLPYYADSHVDQYQEHLDSLPEFANEHQAAFAKAQAEIDLQPDRHLIDRLHQLGLVAIVHYTERPCPYTDAILGMQQTLICGTTSERAEQLLQRLNREGDEYGHHAILASGDWR